MKVIVVFLVVLVLFSCGSDKNSCILPEPETIFYDYNSEDNYYDHYVLLNDYNRACMDSLEMLALAQKYVKDLKKGKPSFLVRFYSSDKDFIDGEVSQPMEIDASCLLLIAFDSILQPKRFVFYNEKGDWVYRGPLWRPNGE